MEKLTVILLSFMLQATRISGATDCTPPWMAQSNPFYAKVLSKSVYRCPSVFGDSNKEYCCYNSDGDVECCNFQEYFVFRLFCLFPIILIVLIILSFVCCMCCWLCPFCMIYKRRQTRRCALCITTISSDQYKISTKTRGYHLFKYLYKFQYFQKFKFSQYM